jgi:predicted transcriptional regulator
MAAQQSDADDLAPLSGAQLEIMNLVWARGEATVTEIWKELEVQRPIARTTVLTVMDRLEKKGWLKRRVEGQQHYYSPARSRARALGGLVERLVDTAFAGSAEDLVMALLDGRGVTEEEAKRIRRLIDKARRNRS